LAVGAVAAVAGAVAQWVMAVAVAALQLKLFRASLPEELFRLQLAQAARAELSLAAQAELVIRLLLARLVQQLVVVVAHLPLLLVFPVRAELGHQVILILPEHRVGAALMLLLPIQQDLAEVLSWVVVADQEAQV
jgi:hypothetical protein